MIFQVGDPDRMPPPPSVSAHDATYEAPFPNYTTDVSDHFLDVTFSGVSFSVAVDNKKYSYYLSRNSRSKFDVDVSITQYSACV